MDSILASIIFKPHGLALYMTAKLVCSLFSQGLFAISRLNLIHLGISIGRKRREDEISSYLTKSFVFVYMVLIPILILICYPLFFFIVQMLLPNYAGSTLVLLILLITTFFSPKALFLRNAWIQKSDWQRLNLSGLLGFFFQLLIFVVGYQFFGLRDLQIFAMIVVIGQFPYAVTVVLWVSRSVCSTRHLIIRILAFIFGLSLSIAILLFHYSYFFDIVPTIVSYPLQYCLAFLLVIFSIYLSGIISKRVE